jgi:protocatechuate 3,4-dioxygenase, beta subunit
MNTVMKVIMMTLTISQAALAHNHMLPTPEQTAGPFYPGARAFLDKGNDLANSFTAKGDQIVIRGHVVDRGNYPIANAEVQIWQTDGDQGRYLVEQTDKPIDPDFNYHGKVMTNGNGEFELRTVRPKEYEANGDWIRPDHVHVRVLTGNRIRLTTQMYFADDKELIDKDLILQAMTPEQRAAVIVDFQMDPMLTRDAGKLVKAGHFHIVLK